MSIPSGATKVVIAGSGAQTEIFETGFWLIGADVSSAADANLLCASISEIIADSGDHETAVSNLLNADFQYDEVRSYTYTGSSTATWVGRADMSISGSSASRGPLQQCVVATLLTGLSGRRNRGRMYWPASGLATQTGYQVSASVVTALSQQLADIFNEINGNEAAGVVSVVSQTGSTSHPVTSVRVDSKPDIQRRRANKEQALTVVSSPVS
jgi:hypothetical protein